MKNQKDFDLVNKLGSRLFSPHFLIVLSVVRASANFCASTSSSLVKVRLGMKVGRRLGNSIIRNKVKRRIRHLMRLFLYKFFSEHKVSLMNIEINLIVIPKKYFERIKFSVLQRYFEKLLFDNLL